MAEQDYNGLSNRDLLLHVLNRLDIIDDKIDGKIGRMELFGWFSLFAGLVFGTR